MGTPAVNRIPTREQPPPPQRLTAGAYITDEISLFRCLSIEYALQPEPTIMLEDCLSLDVLILPLTEAISGGMRIVRDAPPGEDQTDTAAELRA